MNGLKRKTSKQSGANEINGKTLQAAISQTLRFLKVLTFFMFLPTKKNCFILQCLEGKFFLSFLRIVIKVFMSEFEE